MVVNEFLAIKKQTTARAANATSMSIRATVGRYFAPVVDEKGTNEKISSITIESAPKTIASNASMVTVSATIPIFCPGEFPVLIVIHKAAAIISGEMRAIRPAKN